jgi:hypothetical protein
MLLEMDAKADRKKRDRSITAALWTARRVARQLSAELWTARLAARQYVWWNSDHYRALREIERIERLAELRLARCQPARAPVRAHHVLDHLGPIGTNY